MLDAPDVYDPAKAASSSNEKKWNAYVRRKLIDVCAEARQNLSIKLTFFSDCRFRKTVSSELEAIVIGRGSSPPEECIYQMIRMLDIFKKVCDNEMSTGQGARRHWVSYDKLFLILGKSHTIKPPVTVSVGTSNMVQRYGAL